MAKQTKADRIAQHLTNEGYLEVTSTSRKYRKFVRGDRTLWLGKCGAVRAGRTVSDSVSLSAFAA